MVRLLPPPSRSKFSVGYWELLVAPIDGSMEGGCIGLRACRAATSTAHIATAQVTQYLPEPLGDETNQGESLRQRTGQVTGGAALD
jgi:hypothetical protein